MGLTALIYLNTPFSGSGGGTWFPYVGTGAGAPKTVDQAIRDSLAIRGDISVTTNSTTTGINIRPSAGSAVIFFNHRLDDGLLDPAAVHSGNKVMDSKLIANWWLGMKVFDTTSSQS